MALIRQYGLYDCGDGRLGVVVSPNEMNAILRTVIVAPVTKTVRDLPFYTAIMYQNETWMVTCDQLQTVQRQNLQTLGHGLTQNESKSVNMVLCTMFSI